MGCFSFFFVMKSGLCQVYEGTGFPAAVQFKSILPPALRVTVSSPGWMKVGGSEDEINSNRDRNITAVKNTIRKRQYIHNITSVH